MQKSSKNIKIKYNNWEEVFASAKPMTFHAFNTGRITGKVKTYADATSFPENVETQMQAWPEQLLDLSLFCPCFPVCFRSCFRSPCFRSPPAIDQLRPYLDDTNQRADDISKSQFQRS